MKAKCACGWLDEMVNDPNVPIKYSEHLKEYVFEYSPRKNVYNFLRIDYCPSCGGKALGLNTKCLIPEKELANLRKLTGKISTFKDAVKVLGKPDYERACNTTTYEWHSHSRTVIIDGLELHPNKFFVNFRKK